MSIEAYREQLFSMFPPGRLWPDDPDSTLQRLLLALSVRLDAVEQSADQALDELHPPVTVLLIEEWERLLGLPDECAPPAQTIQERRARVLERLTVRPNPTVAYLAAICSTLGYVGVVITESGPYELTVDVPEPIVIYFRSGESLCGDLLGKIVRATDLECILREQKPAHLSLVFNYSGV